MVQHPSNANQHALALGRAVLQTIEHISQNGQNGHSAAYSQASMVPLANGGPHPNGQVSSAVGDLALLYGQAAVAAQAEVAAGHAQQVQNIYAVQSGTMGELMYAPHHTNGQQDATGRFYSALGADLAAQNSSGMSVASSAAAPTYERHDQSMTRVYPGDGQQGNDAPGGNACQYLQSYSAFFPSSETLQQQLQSGKRACSYCHVKGHNVRTCDKKRHDFQKESNGPFYVQEIPLHASSSKHKRQRVDVAADQMGNATALSYTHQTIV